MTFVFAWLSNAGTLLILAGILTMLTLRVSPARALKAYADTLVQLRTAIVTVMAVLSLAYVMNQSGQTTTLGFFLAGAGGVFVLFSPILGWLGVAVTGSDTSSNALFGALQVQTAAKAGLDPVLLAASNSSGGVMGKMISPQNLAIAAAAVGMAGREGEIFRKVLGWSLLLLAAHVCPGRAASHARAGLDGPWLGSSRSTIRVDADPIDGTVMCAPLGQDVVVHTALHQVLERPLNGVTQAELTLWRRGCHRARARTGLWMPAGSAPWFARRSPGTPPLEDH